MTEDRYSQGSFKIKGYELEVKHQVELPLIGGVPLAKPLIDEIDKARIQGCGECRGLWNLVRVICSQTSIQIEELSEVEAKCTPQDEAQVYYQIEAEHVLTQAKRGITNVRCNMAEYFRKRTKEIE